MNACWVCWFCPRVFCSPQTRVRHMSVRHSTRNRLVPPEGFVEQHLRPAASGHGAVLRETHGDVGHAFTGDDVGGVRLLSPAGHQADTANDAARPELGGLGFVRIPPDGFTRGSLAVPRPRHVFYASTAARIRAYYESLPEASKTRRLVPPEVGLRLTRFNTPLLREVLKFALSAGGPGLSQADQMWYVSVLFLAEEGAFMRQDGGRHIARARRRAPPAPQEHAPTAPRGIHPGDPSDGEGGELAGEVGGEVTQSFGSRSAFVSAVREEQRRVLSKLCWDETPLEVEGGRFVFYSRDLLHVVLDLLRCAEHVQFWGEELGLAPDATRLRADMLDSDLFLAEESIVRGRHGSLAFVLGVQLFVDEAVVSWSGAHYVYPIRVRVLNVRDRTVQWVTVGYVPHVGKPVERSAAARRRASDARNGLLQRCLAILLRRFIGASQDGVTVSFAGSPDLLAVPRLLGLVADQLGERSVVCLMGNSCEFFCSHCMVRRDVAGGPEGMGADGRDVTTGLDAQLVGAVTRDRDPRPSLRGMLRTEYSALAFVPAIAAVAGLATDNQLLYRIISFDLLHVWKLGVIRMVAQRFPAFLRVACGGGAARLGPVQQSLDALNKRAWEMGHLCVPSPTPPGYVAVWDCFFLPNSVLVHRTGVS